MVGQFECALAAATKGSTLCDSLKQEFRSAKPFPHVRIENVFSAAVADAVQDELMAKTFYPKRNDLYSFHQSGELKNATSPNLVGMRTSMYSQAMRDALQLISGIELNDTVDMTAAVYGCGDNLLCHDDKLQGRRIAYIYYLVPEDWTESDGGALELFECDEQCEPYRIVKSLVPKRNSLVLFEVNEHSYHQVQEVLSPSKLRLAIGGWYHGPARDDCRPVPIERVVDCGAIESRDEKLPEWINTLYLKADIADQISDQFIEESSIDLGNFLCDEKYAQVLAALNQQQWSQVGPYNKRNFMVPCSPLHPILDSLLSLFRSKAFVDFLVTLCGDIEVTAAGGELRRFDPGCYTLAFDSDPEKACVGLDVTLSLGAVEWNDGELECGGDLVYLDEREDEELLSVPPSSNSVSLVYRSEPGTMRFIKYVDRRAPSARFDLSMVYRVLVKNEEA
jgi:prolyl 3-hydroxylase /prolyl 3,4-dihydroxylase